MTNGTPVPPPVQKSLSLVLKQVESSTIPPSSMLALGGDIAASSSSTPGNGILHFAWVVQLAPKIFLLSTVYDNEFEPYLDSFIDSGHEKFDAVLPGVEGGAALVPVQQHRKEFYEFVRKNDLTGGGLAPLFSAYPTLTVIDIVTG